MGRTKKLVTPDDVPFERSIIMDDLYQGDEQRRRVGGLWMEVTCTRGLGPVFYIRGAYVCWSGLMLCWVGIVDLLALCMI